MRQRKGFSATVVCLLAISLLAAGIGTVEAEISALNPTDDTYVSSLSPNTNFDNPNDNNQEIFVNSSGPPLTSYFIGYLRFDVSGLTAAQVQNVWFRVYEQLQADSSVTVSLYGTTSNDWNGGATPGNGDETTLTYSNAPAASGGALDSVAGDGTARWWVFQSAALTQYVQDHLPGGTVGDGMVTFRLEATGSGLSQLCSFEDRENGGGTGNPPELAVSPTAVELASFTATSGQGRILVEWSTASEWRFVGFHLFRAGSPTGMEEGLAVRLNEDLIPATGGNIQGGSYSHADLDVEAGARYYYWLEAVDVGGGSVLHGPVSAVLEDHIIFLPFAASQWECCPE